jgi:putative beta-1,4-xylosyltransferase IRX9
MSTSRLKVTVENVPHDFLMSCRRFGTWPVATHVGARYKVVLEGPVCRGNQVTGWHTNKRGGVPRRFPIGFSGFAFNSTILWDPQRWNSPTLESIILHSGGRGGLQVSIFITIFVQKKSRKQRRRLYVFT